MLIVDQSGKCSTHQNIFYGLIGYLSNIWPGNQLPGTGSKHLLTFLLANVQNLTDKICWSLTASVNLEPCIHVYR